MVAVGSPGARVAAVPAAVYSAQPKLQLAYSSPTSCPAQPKLQPARGLGASQKCITVLPGPPPVARQASAPSAPLWRSKASADPVPVPPPRGLLGFLTCGPARDRAESFPEDYVLLNVYDIGGSEFLSGINRVSTVNNSLLIGGVFHAGVQLYGREWCYNYTDDGSTGLTVLRPRKDPDHIYRTTVPLGKTSLSFQQVRLVVTRLAKEWKGEDYHIFHKNCLDFCNAFCSELGVGRIPGWIDRFGRTASFLDNLADKAACGLKKPAQLAKKWLQGEVPAEVHGGGGKDSRQSTIALSSRRSESEKWKIC